MNENAEIFNAEFFRRIGRGFFQWKLDGNE